MTEYELDKGVWKKTAVTIDNDGNESIDWYPCLIMDVPAERLLQEWEDLVLELSQKEVELYNLKEAFLIAESEIVNTTDFKELYGANNQKVRDNHVKSELSDMVSQMKDLEFGIDWIKRYIPLVKSVVSINGV